MLPLPAKSSLTGIICHRKSCLWTCRANHGLCVPMIHTVRPEKLSSPVIGRLFGLVTSQLEIAHEISLNGHHPEMNRQQAGEILDELQVQLSDIDTLVMAVEQLIEKDSGSAEAG